MNPFEFGTVPRVVFGVGAVDDIVALTRDFGRQALVVHGRSPERAGRVVARLHAAGIATTPFVVSAEPDTNVVMQGTALAREAEAELVIGVGGGSVIDAAKAISALATNDEDVFEYLEIVGRGRPLQQPSLPCVAIPTTAGTGTEVTKNAVLASPAHHLKVSLRGPFVLPRLAVVDPSLTFELPASITATTGLDALTQLLEAYVSRRANPMTDMLCLDGLGRAAIALRRAFHDGADHDARADMSLASLWSGMALSNAGLGAVHGFAAPIGGLFDAPHGAVCAALLPHVVATNLRAIETRVPDHPARTRFTDIARLLTGRPSASAQDAVTWLTELVDELHVPRLGAYGISASHVTDLVDKAAKASSMKGNPLELTRDELANILAAAI